MATYNLVSLKTSPSYSTKAECHSVLSWWWRKLLIINFRPRYFKHLDLIWMNGKNRGCTESQYMCVQRPEYGAKKAKKEGPEGVRAVQSMQELQLMTSSMKAVADGLFSINKAGDELSLVYIPRSTLKDRLSRDFTNLRH